MPSKPSIDRQKASTVFRSVENSHVRDVLPVIDNRLRGTLVGEEILPDIPLLATLLGRIQAGGTRRLTVADNAHDEELAGDSEHRLRRDTVGERVHRKLVEIRRIADGLFGPERSGEVLATSGPTAPVVEGERLWRQAEDTVTRLEAPGFAIPAMTTSSLQFDPLQLASELRGDNNAFRQALDTVALEQRKAEASLATKNARIDEATRIDAACARIYEGFFLLADRADLLERLRRALRRRARRAPQAADPVSVPDDGEPPSGDEPGDGEPPQDGEASALSND